MGWYFLVFVLWNTEFQPACCPLFHPASLLHLMPGQSCKSGWYFWLFTWRYWSNAAKKKKTLTPVKIICFELHSCETIASPDLSEPVWWTDKKESRTYVWCLWLRWNASSLLHMLNPLVEKRSLFYYFLSSGQSNFSFCVANCKWCAGDLSDS